MFPIDFPCLLPVSPGGSCPPNRRNHSSNWYLVFIMYWAQCVIFTTPTWKSESQIPPSLHLGSPRSWQCSCGTDLWATECDYPSGSCHLQQTGAPGSPPSIQFFLLFQQLGWIWYSNSPSRYTWGPGVPHVPCKDTLSSTGPVTKGGTTQGTDRAWS